MTGINVVASATSVVWKVQLSSPFCSVKTIVTGSATTCPIRPTLANFKLGATAFGKNFIGGLGLGNGEVFHILATLNQNDVLYGAMPIIEPI